MSAAKFSKPTTSGLEAAGATDVEARQPIDPMATARLAPLTGRDTEVSLLKDRWEQATEGMGQVVLLIGEAGLGKSRLVSIIKELVEGEADEPAQDSPIIEWRCSRRFQNTSLYPACDFFDRLLDFGRDQAPGVRFDRLARHLEAYDLARPESVALFASLLLLSPDDRIAPLSLSPIREREETFRALREWLRARARRRPVLFVVEDLHWVDASTLEFLGQFLAEGFHDRILTVLTFRPEFKTPWPAVAHQTSLALNRLSRRQVAELVRKDTGAALPEPLLEQIYQRTAGVPLFTEELTRMLRDPGMPGRSPKGGTLGGEMPATLHDLVIARLDRMTSDREIAQLAATLGREFTHELLAAVATVDEPTLQAELAKLIRAEILYQRGSPPRCTYVFKHALLEDALRDALVGAKRQGFHRQIADVLVAQFPQTVEGMPELLAHHYTEADLADKAVRFWLIAGLRSRDRFANFEAIGHLSRGLELLRTLDESPERDARELEFLNPLGTVFIAARGYGAPEVGPIFRRARELGTRVGTPPQLFAIMWGAWAWHAVRADLRLCMELADEALALAERVNEPGMLMEALFPGAVTLVFRGDFAAAYAHCTRALAEYDDRERTRFWAGVTGEDSGVAHRCYLAVALWHLGKVDEALRLNHEAVELARAIRQPFTLAFALEHRAWLCNQARLTSEARTAAQEELAIATEQGFAYWRASAALFKADSMVLQGQWQEMLPLILDGLEDLRGTGAGLDVTFHLGFLGDAYTQAGRFADAAKALDEALTCADNTDERFYEAELHRLRGVLLLAESHAHADAEAAFCKAIEIARRQQSKAWELRATTSLARLWHRQGRGNKARAALAAVYCRYTEGFSTPDLVDAKALLDTLGDERMREEFAAGAKYVLSCIPAPIDGPVSIDWRYIPSSSLGGDTIGYHWIDDNHLALYLVDVTGHGLDSALLSVSITDVLRSGSLTGTDMRRPDQVLATLNDAFPGDQHGDKFFTIWYGVYERSSATLTWSGGGHHPSILLAPGARDPILLSSGGMMMGVARGLEYPAASCQVPPEARLLIFSDGIFEIVHDGNVVWTLGECIEYLATQNSHGGAGMDELLAHVRALRGSHELQDDFSILVACFRQNVKT
ncbi:MAG TPA: SpoIIE family protein phosphatase [Tepidisphaeraceae bacterium]|nr:SpoIIE family protein phosphatase [Tepidisphaeraceae bacterium]